MQLYRKGAGVGGLQTGVGSIYLANPFRSTTIPPSAHCTAHRLLIGIFRVLAATQCHVPSTGAQQEWFKSIIRMDHFFLFGSHRMSACRCLSPFGIPGRDGVNAVAAKVYSVTKTSIIMSLYRLIRFPPTTQCLSPKHCHVQLNEGKADRQMDTLMCALLCFTPSSRG